MASCKTLHKLIKQEGEGYLIHLQAKGVVPTPVVIPGLVIKALEVHQDVFEMSGGLSPKRGKFHVIILKEGTLPVSVRPYCYPQV